VEDGRGIQPLAFIAAHRTTLRPLCYAAASRPFHFGTSKQSRAAGIETMAPVGVEGVYQPEPHARRRTMALLKKLVFAGVSAVAIGAFAAPASANIIYDSSINITGQGFGNAPRLLTLQEKGNGDNIESGCVRAGAGGSISFGAGACIGDPSAGLFQGNGKANVGGDEVQPQADNQKFGVPTLAELGFRDASDIGLLFNAIEPGGDGVSIDDVTLKFYDTSGSLLAAIDGSHQLSSTFPGNGNAGFVFTVDATQQAFLNSAIFNLPNFSDIRIALESTISNAQAGPESWLAFNTGRSGGSSGGTPVPAPAGLGLFALAALGLAAKRRRRK
jgi:hypothetical protein